MDGNKKIFYRNQAEGLIKKLELHKMKGYYCDSVSEAKEKILELIGDGKKTVAYGGSMIWESRTSSSREVMTLS